MKPPSNVTSNVIFVAIAGASASGKTLLSDNIIRGLQAKYGTDVALIPEDSYYKDLSHLELRAREEVNFDHPDAFDHELLLKHVSDLRSGKPIHIPTYDYLTNVRGTETEYVVPAKIVIVEGIMLLAEEVIRKEMDIKVYVDTPLDLCILRRIERDVIQRGRSVESVVEQYKKTVRPMFLQFIEPSKKYADIIIPRGGKNLVAVSLIHTLLEKLLRSPQEDCVDINAAIHSLASDSLHA